MNQGVFFCRNHIASGELAKSSSCENNALKKHALPSHLLEEFKRREFDELYNSLNKTDLVTLLVGGRRVGKSILLFQLMNQLFENGVDYRNVLFIQGDNPTLQGYNDSGLLINAVLSEYKKFIRLHNPPEGLIYVVY